MAIAMNWTSGCVLQNPMAKLLEQQQQQQKDSLQVHLVCYIACGMTILKTPIGLNDMGYRSLEVYTEKVRDS